MCRGDAAGVRDAVRSGLLHLLRSNRSACHLKLGAHEAALADADACAALRPGWAKGWGRKAEALARLGRAEEAKQAYATALELAPTSEALRKGLAALNLSEGGANVAAAAAAAAAPPAAAATSTTK